ncbi:bifunctional diguanylate cyclase/phosphodiesterase [Epibacterium ulvae]|uniref:bifunctional diguanylate cyclase/phosphodiesterase n=1 Tax=Epibacterium ulvae TaxID=1156985 RepID=UPI00248F82AA|nr:diguanylate cyclase [Epibacterium ulvae]
MRDGDLGPECEHTDGEFYARLVSEHCADSIIITDENGYTQWVNASFAKNTGFSLADALNKRPCSLMQGPDTCADSMKHIQLAREERRSFKTELLQYTKDGDPFWVELKINPVFDDTGQHTHFVEVERDITERKQLELASIEAVSSEKRRRNERKLLTQTSEWLYSSKSLPELLQVVEASMRAIFPETSGELYIYSNSRDTLDLVANWGSYPNDTDHIDPDCCWALRRGRPYIYGVSHIEFACEHHQDVDKISFCLPLMAHGETIGLLHLAFSNLTVDQISEAEAESLLSVKRDLALACAEQISLSVANVKLRQELQDQSTRDPLTSLWNRRWFLDTASRELNRARSLNTPVSLISLDVDHFKKFNDHYGHDAGDVVLREVGGVMSQVFKDKGYACRIGGEEFVVLCPAVALDEATELAETLRVAMSSHEVCYGRQKLPSITISAGVVCFPEDGDEIVKLLRAADEYLYRAKHEGRNKVVAG